jgi:hypothetical protein
MTPHGGPGRGQGRKSVRPTPGNRHTVRVSDEVWAFLKRYGAHPSRKGSEIEDASAGIERLAREQMARDAGQTGEGGEE